MAGSRLEKLGTIFTRVNGLIKSGAMKVDDRPIWYDVYRAFPPESEPHYAKPAQPLKIPNIFFPEDIFRAEFHKKTRSQLPPVHLKETYHKQNVTKIALDMVAADQSLSVDQVINTLKTNGIIQVYNSTSQKESSTKNSGSTNKFNIVNEINNTSEVKSS